MTKLMSQGESRIDFKVPNLGRALVVESLHGCEGSFVSFDFIALSLFSSEAISYPYPHPDPDGCKTQSMHASPGLFVS